MRMNLKLVQNKKKKPKKDFLGGYKIYTGHRGNASQWKKAFQERMNPQEAIQILGSDDPHSILGIPQAANIHDIKAAYRKLAMKHHPDMNKGNEAEATEKFKKIQAAYTMLTK